VVRRAVPHSAEAGVIADHKNLASMGKKSRTNEAYRRGKLVGVEMGALGSEPRRFFFFAVITRRDRKTNACRAGTFARTASKGRLFFFWTTQ